MEQFEWSDIYSVGVRKIDAQHRQIVEMINMLISDPGATVYSETVSELLDKLTKYSREHFKTEENLLSKHEYPDLSSQKEEHKAYRTKIAGLCVKTMDHMDSVPEDILNFLKSWWENHILDSDMKYSAYLMERGVE